MLKSQIKSLDRHISIKIKYFAQLFAFILDIFNQSLNSQVVSGFGPG